MSDLVLPNDFKQTLIDRVRATVMGLIPDSALETMIATEIETFFNTASAVTLKKATIDRASGHETTRSSWGNNNVVDVMLYQSHLTPFRQIVWVELHQFVSTKLREMLDDENSKLRKSIAEVLVDATKSVGVTHKETILQMAAVQASTMFSRAQQEAISLSHQNLLSSMASVGLNTSNIPSPMTYTSPI